MKSSLFHSILVLDIQQDEFPNTTSSNSISSNSGNLAVDGPIASEDSREYIADHV